MDDEIIVMYQRLIDGVVVSVGIDDHLHAWVRSGDAPDAEGQLEYRLRKATDEEKMEYADGDVLPKGTPV